MPPDLLTRDNVHIAQADAFPLTIQRAVVESPPAPSFAEPSDAARCTSLDWPARTAVLRLRAEPNGEPRRDRHDSGVFCGSHERFGGCDTDRL